MPKTSSTSSSSNNRKPRARKEPTSKPPVTVEPISARTGDLEERIRQRAYELYEQEGRQAGRDEEYWLRAEAEILGRKSA